MIWWLLALTIVQFIIILFLWWQFSFTDSKLCKLIDNRSKSLEDTYEFNGEENDDE